MRTRHPRSLTSPASHSTLLPSIIISLRLLVPLGMRISGRRALLKRDGRSAQHRRQLRGAHACFPYHTLSSTPPGGSTASESIAPTVMASLFRLARSGVRTGISHSTLTLPGEESRRARAAGRAPACRSGPARARPSRGQGSMRPCSSRRGSPVAGVSSLSRAICSALSSMPSAALARLRARRQQSASRRGREPAQG